MSRILRLLSRVSVGTLLLMLSFGTAEAADKKIVVVEKSSNAADKTHHKSNKKNLPAGATAVEAGDLDEAESGILGELGAGDCIKELHFRGHGSPGNQSVGDGVNHEDDKRIDGTDWETELAGLQGKFCEDATIHLWGCNVGSCDEGAAKLKELADEFGVTAKGAVDTVTAGEQNDYDGPVQEATPDDPQPECIEATDEKADGADSKQEGDLTVAADHSLDTIALDPEAYVVELSMSDVLAYSETLEIPGCAPVSPELVDLNGLISFSDHPDPQLIRFHIEALDQALAPFKVCGMDVGPSLSVLATNYLAEGTIGIVTGEIIGAAAVRHYHALGGFLIPNEVRGSWFPTDLTVVELHFAGLPAFPEGGDIIPALPEIGLVALAMILAVVALLAAGARVRRASSLSGSS